MGSSPPLVHPPPLLHPYHVRPVRPEKPPHSPRLWEKAGKAGKEPRPSAGPKKWPSSSSSRSSGPGNWLKGSFLRHILLSAGLAQDRQEDKQTIRKVLIRRLSFSHFPTVSEPQTRVNSDPSEPSVGLFIKMMRLAWQLGWWTHICTALFTPQGRQLKHKAKRSSRSNAVVVISSNIDMPSWENYLHGCQGWLLGCAIMEILI